jgi:hypothetical protein
MRWLLFAAVCVAALVALGILAVDERDVAWERDRPLCPYCRNELKLFALACKECRHAVDWVPRQEPCPWCLEPEEATRMRGFALDLELRGRDMPPPLREFTDAYFADIQAGDCPYCGGLGEVQENGGRPRRCPVCFGRRKCIACDGDRVLLRGEPAAHRRRIAREEAREAELRRARLLGHEPPLEAMLAADVEQLAGYVEATELRDAEGRRLVELARGKAERAFAGLREARRLLSADAEHE